MVSCVFSSFIDVPFQWNDDLASEFHFFLGVSMNSQQEIYNQDDLLVGNGHATSVPDFRVSVSDYYLCCL